MTNWKILGIEDSDGERCECCGTCCPKRRIVLTDGQSEVRYGSSCAAFKLIGNKKASSNSLVILQARGVSLAKKWLASGHRAKVVANDLRVRELNARERDGGVEIDGVGFISSNGDQHAH